MPDSTSPSEPTITPYLYYEDAGAALEWLTRVFGFEEREAETMRNEAGRVVHGAIELGEGVVLLGSPGADYRSPGRLGQATQSLYVYVDDLDAHYARSKQAGAKILSEPEETFYGDRRYGAVDLEGHEWYFAEKLRSFPPEEWAPSSEDLAGHG